MPKYSVDGNDVTPTHIDMWDFFWSEFEREKWDDDQKFIIVFNDNDEMIMTKYDIESCPTVKAIGIKAYMAINMVI